MARVGERVSPDLRGGLYAMFGNTRRPDNFDKVKFSRADLTRWPESHGKKYARMCTSKVGSLPLPLRSHVDAIFLSGTGNCSNVRFVR